jgi:cytochrome o ubiquinol oxidase operon protein cyoD
MSNEATRDAGTDVNDRAPGFGADAATGSVLGYTVGLVFALLLTATSFFITKTDVFWGPGLPVGLAVLAIAQMGVHLVFFLHIGTGPDNTNNVLALAFGILIVTLVVSGSLWIMAHLNANMMPPSAIMEMSR